MQPVGVLKVMWMVEWPGVGSSLIDCLIAYLFFVNCRAEPFSFYSSDCLLAYDDSMDWYSMSCYLIILFCA